MQSACTSPKRQISGACSVHTGLHAIKRRAPWIIVACTSSHSLRTAIKLHADCNAGDWFLQQTIEITSTHVRPMSCHLIQSMMRCLEPRCCLVWLFPKLNELPKACQSGLRSAIRSPGDQCTDLAMMDLPLDCPRVPSSLLLPHHRSSYHGHYCTASLLRLLDFT